MNYIGLMNQMWRSAMKSPMPASEIALFAYLVNECNKRFCQMPCFKTDGHHGKGATCQAQTYLVHRRQITSSTVNLYAHKLDG